MEYPGFCGPSGAGRSVVANAEETINWRLLTQKSPEAKMQRILMPTWGVIPWGNGMLDAPCRGAFGQDGRFFVVGGGKFQEVNADGNPIHSGDVASDGQLATLCSNGDGGDQVFITSGGKGYIYNRTTFVLTQVLSSARFGGMIDTFFVALDTNTSTLQISASYNGLVWDPTQIIQRGGASDRWRAMIIGPSGGEIYLIGDRTSDVYYDKGTSPIPFAPVTSSRIEYGTEAPNSLAWLNGPVWLAQNKGGARTVRRSKGYDTQKISDDAVDAQLATYASVVDAEGEVFTEDGHELYALHIPSQNVSHVYDELEQAWHKRTFWDVGTGRDKVSRGRHHNYIFGKTIMGDRETNQLYEANPAYGMDVAGAAIRRLRRTAGLAKERRKLFFSSLEIYYEIITGAAVGQGADPLIMFRTSKNGGKTYGGIRQKKLGKAGKFNKRVKFNQIGAARDRVDEIVVTDPVPIVILGAVLEPQGATPT